MYILPVNLTIEFFLYIAQFSAQYHNRKKISGLQTYHLVYSILFTTMHPDTSPIFIVYTRAARELSYGKLHKEMISLNIYTIRSYFI